MSNSSTLTIRVDYLTTQYVWALENDQAFMLKARHEAERSNFNQFRRLVGSYIIPTRRTLGDMGEGAFTGAEWSFLYLEMWLRLRSDDVYPNMNTANYDDFEFHVGRLNEAGFVLTGRGVVPMTAPILHNPCAEIALPTQPVQPQEKTVSNQITIQNKTFINGVDVAGMSDEQLIDAIKKVEKEVEELNSVKTKSKKITAKVEQAQATLAQLVELLDGR